ncbi:MAG: hypothetical protein LBK61_13610 [Spirochaetaceae bacterium]|jgi:hypothetical protein|nr:hypothetical protein [Spirochaetaceae bacterium]
MMQGNTSNLNALIASRGGFIRETLKETLIEETAKPGVSIDTSQKAFLNRKGNMLFNEGNVEGARRIFVTTGYSDGLSRIGDYYRKQGKVIDALQMYRIAPNKRKADELVMSIALLIRSMLVEHVTLSGGRV